MRAGLHSASMPTNVVNKSASPSHSEEVHFDHEVEEFIHNDADRLMHEFKSAFENLRKGLSRPKVLIAGVAGAGKRF